MDLAKTIKIGTRGSPLALVQTALVQAELASRYPDLKVEVVRISTVGDRVQDRPLAALGGKASFVAEIESALREGRIHMAVHSAKDIPSELPYDMRIAACLPREDARDALIAHEGHDIESLPNGARVGTSSPRRACQLRALRPDIQLLDVRGNVETRLAKFDAGDYDAVVLAAAGLSRLGLLHRATHLVPFNQMLPCGGQGAIAIEVCANDPYALALVSSFDHAPTSIAVAAERAFLGVIGGSCSTPLAAHATVVGNTLELHAVIGASDGRFVRAERRGAVGDAVEVGRQLGDELLAAGGANLLRDDGFVPATSNSDQRLGE